MNSEIKVLIVSPEYPYPSHDGHKVRVYNLLRNLPPQYRFDFLAFGEANQLPDEEVLRKQLGASCDTVELISHTTIMDLEPKRLMRRISNIFFPFKESLGKPCFSVAMAEKVKAMTAANRYDLVFLCGFSSLLYFDPREESAPYVVDMCDSVSLFMQNNFKKERRPLRKLASLLDYVWACRYEMLHASGIQNIILISDIDAEQVRRHCPQSKIRVVPNGVDAEHFQRRGASPVPNSLLFTGVMDYAPNDEAMLYFITEIFPLVKSRIPEAVLTIAGKNPTSHLKDLVSQTSGVRLTGFVDDLRKSFESATVYVSPLLTGGGMKNKVLEAWSMTLPVVATMVSCSGIATSDNKNILIADSPREFADKVVSLLQDEPLRMRLSAAGRLTVVNHYSWSSRSQHLAHIFDEILQQQAVVRQEQIRINRQALVTDADGR